MPRKMARLDGVAFAFWAADANGRNPIDAKAGNAISAPVPRKKCRRLVEESINIVKMIMPCQTADVSFYRLWLFLFHWFIVSRTSPRALSSQGLMRGLFPLEKLTLMTPLNTPDTGERVSTFVSTLAYFEGP